MTLLSSPRIVIVNSAGQPYALAKLYTYRATTTTNLTTYTTAAFSTPHANPVVADANGVFAPIYVDPALGYNLRVIAYDSNDVAISGWDIDNIPASDNVFSSGITVAGNSTITGTLNVTGGLANATTTIQASNPRLIFDETDASTDKRKWDFFVNGNILSLRTRTDADGTGKDILAVTRGVTTAISGIDIGNATDLPAISLNGTTLVAANIAQNSASSFTATFTDMTTATTGTVYYVKTGRMATLYVQTSITGTSNATAMGMSGMPATIYPAYAGLTVPCYNVADAGGPIAAYVHLATSLFTFAPLNGDGVAGFVTGSVTGFTNSGTKGVYTGWSITYPTAT